MRRSLPLAALAALALAAPAAAFLPHIPAGTVVGEGRPLRAYASLTPQVHLFGDAVTARVAVVADRKWVDPTRLRVTADFAPFRPVRRPEVLELASGRFVQLTWTWTLRCLTSPCVPRTPPSDTLHVFHFPPARIEYLAHDGQRFGITAGFPPLETLSQISPGVVDYLASHNALNWQWRLTPVGAPAYRASPSLVFWLALALAGVVGAAGLALAVRFALSFRRPAVAVGLGPAATPLERAIALLAWARERGDETLQRKALERIADELSVDVRDLSEVAHTLAWSPETPEEEDVRAISERARLAPHGEGDGA